MVRRPGAGRLHERRPVRAPPDPVRGLVRRPRASRYGGPRRVPQRGRLPRRHRPGAPGTPRHVVVATGPHGQPHVPPGLGHAGDATVLHSSGYRNPARLAPGGVLVVGASASGVQIADELARAGREVVLAVGRHSRMPRRYRGMDVFWWMEGTGRLARTIDEMPDPDAARRETSLQLVGRNQPGEQGRDLDLAALQARGVRLVGRVTGVSGPPCSWAATWPARWRRRTGRCTGSSTRSTTTCAGPAWPTRCCPWRDRDRSRVPAAPSRIDARAEGIGTVLLATGFRPDHPWLRLPVLAPDGNIRQRQGVTPVPGAATSSGSGSSTGATRGLSTAPGTTPGPSSRTCSPRPGRSRPVGGTRRTRSRRHERLRRGGRRRPGRRRRHRPAPGPRGRSGSRSSTARRTAATRCPPTR